MICLKCQKDLPKVDSANPKIVCHGCERHICVKCSGLLATELRVVTLQSPTLKYLCPDCVLGVRQLPALRKTIDELKAEIDSIKKIQHQPTGNSVESVISELEERQKRSVNVIMFGIPETTLDDATIDERKQHDTSEVDKALSTLPDPATPVMLVRLGKLDPAVTGPRPLKVVMQNREAAINILKNSKKLGTGISAKNDLTPYQREYLKNLRLELEARTEKGEKDLTIKYIGGRPTIITKPSVNSTKK